MNGDLVYYSDNWPEGELSCVECCHPFEEGEVMSERLVGFKILGEQAIPSIEIICVPCAMAGAAFA